MTSSALQALKTWQDTQFRPWQAAVQRYHAEKAAQTARLQQNLPALQRIAAMLLDGETHRAKLAWNALKLDPELDTLRLAPDGETLTLIPTRGKAQTLNLTALLDELQTILNAEKTVTTPPTIATPPETA